MGGESVFDDDSTSSLDADADPRVGLTDSLDPDFYASGDYEAPAKLKSYFTDKLSASSTPSPGVSSPDGISPGGSPSVVPPSSDPA